MLLIVSGGHAEDLIGASLLQHLAGVEARALPLVGEGKAYLKTHAQVLGPHLVIPSGGFPFNSWQNLVSDLRAGFIQTTLGQWKTAYRQGLEAHAVVAVGDAYSLFVAWLAARRKKLPLFHLQPQVSTYYIGGRSVPERLKRLNQYAAEDYMFYERWLHPFVQAVYVRDKPSEERARQLGMAKARFVGSMAMDMLGPPERSLHHLLDGRPVLALIPGTRGDVAYSLPKMLEAAALLPELQALVAWAPPFEQAVLPPGWTLRVENELQAVTRSGNTSVWLLKQAFSAILHRAKVAIGTAGTANEQAAGIGVPVVGFATLGPQYLPANAERQQRLLGNALALVKADAEVIAEAVRTRLEGTRLRAAAIKDGLERNGPPGALPVIAAEILRALRERG